MHEYPLSDYSDDAKKKLKELELPIPEADPVAYSRDRYAAAPRRLRFQARTRAQAEQWQKTLREKLTELIGGFPSTRSPLRPANGRLA